MVGTKGDDMDAGTLLFLLFLLPCALMVVMMLRGHGHGGHSSHAAPDGGADCCADGKTRRDGPS
jgi:hypothetical protein